MTKPLQILSGGLALCMLSAWLLSCSKGGPATPTNPAPPGGTAELNGSLASSGGQYVHTFATAGTFNYRCTIHPTCSGLTGTVVVIAPGGAIQNRVLGISQSGGTSGPYGSSCSSLSARVDTVFVGDQVTWTNTSPFSHTVTSQ